MTHAQVKWNWLDASETVTLTELSECCGLSTSELHELVDYSALVPLIPLSKECAFSAHWVVPLRAVVKMRLDFDLDLFTVAILLGTLNRIDVLERQVLSLQALLPPQECS
jgi:chaperone modulatory protein CbpM